MRLAVVTLIIALAAIITSAQTPPTLRIVPDGPDRPDLPADLYYGSIKVKPVRLRPGTNTPITINDADFFVSQQYVDFLSRMPDQAGFNFWTNEITGCGATAACIEVKRINTSGAFFLSIEFQETGYLVYRFYKASFGNLAGKPVPVRRDKFIPDSRYISGGVVVGQTGWQQVLENNKKAFALLFVQRPEFQAAFPGSMTAAQFVDTLDANAGRVLSSTDTANLITMLGGTPADPAKRASVVRSVAENSNLQQQEFNKAFVLMQYFGYLKRNPDDAPDTDFAGWQFWLDKLNQFNGNFINAEMVKAFITSIEYNQRF
jgi:hypothetical protein